MHPPLLPSGTRARRARNSAIRNSNRSRPEIPPGDCMASTSRFLQSTLPDTSDLFSSNSFPDSNDSTFSTVTGEIYKMELDGTIVGKFGKAGKQLGEFSGLHEIDCRNPDRKSTRLNSSHLVISYA